MSCFSQSVSMTKRNNIVLLENKLYYTMCKKIKNIVGGQNSSLFNELVCNLGPNYTRTS
jgi:hypothetical protein